MTKSEALQALAEGKKLTHHYFERHEYIKIHDTPEMYETEEGFLITAVQFWNDRRAAFATGWEIFQFPAPPFACLDYLRDEAPCEKQCNNCKK